MDNPTRAKLTVECQVKDKKINVKAKESSPLWKCFVKWIFAIILFCLILSCIVTSKLIFISISHELQPNINKTRTAAATTTTTTSTITMNNTNKYEGEFEAERSKLQEDTDPVADVAYIMISLLMLIPHIISFIRAFRKSAFSSIEPWPKRMSLFMGIVSAILETFGLCLFSFVVIPLLKNPMHGISLMNGVFIIPLLFLMKKEFAKSCRQNNWTTLSFCVFASICSIVGLCLLQYRVFSMKENENRITIMVTIPVSVILLSIAWCPQLSKYQALPINIQSGGTLEKCKININSARQRMTLISSSIKLVLTLIISISLTFLKLTNSDCTYNSLVNGFHHFLTYNRLYVMFFLQVFGSLIGYLATWMAYRINLQRTCLVFPYILSTPLAIMITAPGIGICEKILDSHMCPVDNEIEFWTTIPACLLLWISSWVFILPFCKSQKFLLAKEEALFWLPTYNSILLEQQMVLNRKGQCTDKRNFDYQKIEEKSRTYICTTMYHEADFEMEQLLNSIADVSEGGKDSERQMEAHIIFDDGVRDGVIGPYALQLFSLLKQTVYVDPESSKMYQTPYGLQLNYVLQHGMKFVIHLKDNLKVKNKKRWSQVMYMSYVLDHEGEKDDIIDEMSFILATDADVRFSHTDVMALMDFIIGNPNVAAVCGRLYPMGSGPVIWYQIFDYAIGHWLEKVANDVLGTVLCAPGTFSLYRASAIRDVLPQFATNVNSPADFLRKDMGEDRWLCTLLIEAGWKIEFCSNATSYTYCPEGFEEFFNQRRRWNVSTFANRVEVIEKHKSLRQNNGSVSILFMAYQLFLLISTIIGPSSILLLMAGGVQFAFPTHVNMIVMLIFLIIVTISFGLICMYCTKKTQISVAQTLAFLFTIIMMITAVGCLRQISTNFATSWQLPPRKASLVTIPPVTSNKGNIGGGRAPKVSNSAGLTYDTEEYILQLTAWYPILIVGIVFLTGILHGKEVITLIFGVFYWFCLPTGSLLLMIYSIANITDKTWGTRDGKKSDDKSPSEKRTNANGNADDENVTNVTDGIETESLHKQTGNDLTDNTVQLKMWEMLKLMNSIPVEQLHLADVRENAFWENLKEYCLSPEKAGFIKSKKLNKELESMRNRAMLMFFVVNTLWFTFMGTIMYQGGGLHSRESQLLGVVLTVVYGFILAIQFFALLIHRVTTFIYFVTKAPFFPTKSMEKDVEAEELYQHDTLQMIWKN